MSGESMAGVFTGCNKNKDGVHRVEYAGESWGEITWRCLDCGETFLQDSGLGR